MIWLNVYTVFRDRAVKGIHLGSMFFFTSWGLWNLYYYPHLHQWWSFTGGCSLALANCVWVGAAVYFSRLTTAKNRDRVGKWTTYA